MGTQPDFRNDPPRGARRARCPTVLQMDPAESGAACLAMVLGCFGRFEPSEALRAACGVSRDGTTLDHVATAAEHYGLIVEKQSPWGADTTARRFPWIISMSANRFMVVEGFGRHHVFVNDPATGPGRLSLEEFQRLAPDTCLTLRPGEGFQKGGVQSGLTAALAERLTGSEVALVFVIVASLGLVVPGIVLPAFSKVFVDDFLIAGNATWIKPLLIGLLITGAASTLLTWLQQKYLLRLETKLTLASSSRFLWHLLRLPIPFFDHRFAGDIAARFQANDRIAKLLSGELATTMMNLASVVFFAIVMWIYDPVLTMAGVGLAVANVLALKLVARKRADDNRRFLQDEGNLMATAVSGVQMIETLKASAMESDFFARWAGFQAKVVNDRQHLDARTQNLLAFPPLLSSLSLVVVLGLGGSRVIDGQLTMGTLVAFQLLLSRFNSPIRKLVEVGGQVQILRGDLLRLDDVLRHPRDPLCTTAPDARLDTSVIRKLAGYLELRNLTFGYNVLEPPLLEDFQLTVTPGARIALVGGSGSGKSTIARLIAGLYTPWSGSVLFDGIPIEELPRAVLTTSVAAVNQEVFLFAATVRENITLWDDTISDSDMLQAAKDACIHETVAARSLGYDSLVMERGTNFSGGQRQRLEIARALVTNPAVMILDEATAALDPITEKTIDENLRRRGCTCVIVAHRLSTIRDCDEIIVLDQGKVVQRGTHDDLCAQDGPYAELIRSA